MDLRLPIGYVFTIYGVMLTAYGFFTKDAEMYAKSLGMNVNIIWGFIVLVFGIGMLVAAKARRLTAVEYLLLAAVILIGLRFDVVVGIIASLIFGAAKLALARSGKTKV